MLLKKGLTGSEVGIIQNNLKMLRNLYIFLAFFTIYLSRYLLLEHMKKSRDFINQGIQKLFRERMLDMGKQKAVNSIIASKNIDANWGVANISDKTHSKTKSGYKKMSLVQVHPHKLPHTTYF